jgi:hypothetical protein
MFLYDRSFLPKCISIQVTKNANLKRNLQKDACRGLIIVETQCRVVQRKNYERLTSTLIFETIIPTYICSDPPASLPSVTVTQTQGVCQRNSTHRPGASGTVCLYARCRRNSGHTQSARVTVAILKVSAEHSTLTPDASGTV